MSMLLANLINENLQRRSRVALDEAAGIVRLPLVRVGPEVASEGFFAPGAGRGVANGGEGRHGLVLSWFLQSTDQSPMAAHAGEETKRQQALKTKRISYKKRYQVRTGNIFEL